MSNDLEMQARSTGMEHVTAAPPAVAAPDEHGRIHRKSGAPRRWLRRLLAGLAALAVTAGLVVAWLPKPVEVEAAPVARGPMEVTVDEDGRTRVRDRYVVSAPLAGRVGRMELHAGDMVIEGQVIARVVPLAAPLLDERTRAEASAHVAAAEAGRGQAEAAIGRARLALEYAKDELERQKTLAATGAVSSQAVMRADLEMRTRAEDLASAEFGREVARHELAMAKAAVAMGDRSGSAGAPSELLAVPSPVAGRVLRVLQESEGVVQAGAPLVEIGDPRGLEIVVDVLTTDAVHVTQGARVAVERWGGDQPLEGRVRLVEPSAFTRLSALGVEEQRVNVLVDLTSPAERWSTLGDGYRVETRIVVWEAPDVVTVPASAAFRRGDAPSVFVVRDGRARLVTFEAGRRNGALVEARSGLAPGDEVVLHPSDRVSDGAKVALR